MKLGVIHYLPTAKHYNVFFTHIIFLALTPFGVYLTPSSRSFNPVLVPSPHIKYLCTIVSCLLKIVIFSEIHNCLYH